MRDNTQRRTAMLDHLENALNLATELGEAITAYLIERALDEARSGRFTGVPQTSNTSKT